MGETFENSSSLKCSNLQLGWMQLKSEWKFMVGWFLPISCSGYHEN